MQVFACCAPGREKNDWNDDSKCAGTTVDRKQQHGGGTDKRGDASMSRNTHGDSESSAGWSLGFIHVTILPSTNG